MVIVKNLANFTIRPRSFTPYYYRFNKIFIVSVFQLSQFYLDTTKQVVVYVSI